MAIEKKLLMNNGTDITGMLARAGIRPSPVRILILRELALSERPLSAVELETRLETVDRSSITRSLTLFTDMHLVHAISDGSTTTKYELCQSSGHDHQHTDEHIHFHCSSCGTTICLPGTTIPMPELPNGYWAEHATFVITGLCSACAGHKKE